MKINKQKLEKYVKHIEGAAEEFKSKGDSSTTTEEAVRHCSQLAALTGQLVLLNKILDGGFE